MNKTNHIGAGAEWSLSRVLAKSAIPLVWHHLNIQQSITQAVYIVLNKVKPQHISLMLKHTTHKHIN